MVESQDSIRPPEEVLRALGWFSFPKPGRFEGQVKYSIERDEDTNGYVIILHSLEVKNITEETKENNGTF